MFAAVGNGLLVTVRLDSLSLDAVAPVELARFWAHALRWEVRELDGGGVEIVPGDATGFRVVFRRVEHTKVAQNRIHFDLTTSSLDDRDRTVTELLALGARHVDIGQGPDESHVVLADPEGNEMCIIDPTNRFLAGCPRLGAVNCDGTAALGYFFGDALGWPLVWDQDDETAVQAPEGIGPKVTWSGPPLMPMTGLERFHLHLAPVGGSSLTEAVDELLALGAARRTGDRVCPGAVGLVDVDGNDLCVVG